MIILLDIDGVLVPAKPWISPPTLDDGFYGFNNRSVNALNQIIERSNASIFLTTSHKNKFSISKWLSIFENRGIKINSISRLTTDSSLLTRREEILYWVRNSVNIDDFVIIDDDKSLNDLPKVLKDRLILTKPMIGLTKEHIEQALAILNSPVQLV